MPRRYGYSTRGSRCYGTHDWHAKGRINAIGAITNFSSFLTVMLFESNIDSDIFYNWTKHELLPKIPKKSVIVMDNAKFHKRQDIVDIINQKEMILEYLPTYSPDLNPIEKKWAQVKATRKRHRCDVDELFRKYI